MPAPNSVKPTQVHVGPVYGYVAAYPNGNLIVETMSDDQYHAMNRAEFIFKTPWITLKCLGYTIQQTQVTKVGQQT